VGPDRRNPTLITRARHSPERKRPVVVEPPPSHGTPPTVPAPSLRLSVLALGWVPIGFVLAYVALVYAFFHGEARWTSELLPRVTVLLLAVTAVFAVAWFLSAYLASLFLGDWVTYGVLRMIARLPVLNRHVVIDPPTRGDTSREVWGRFGILLLIALGFELIFMILIVRRGDLEPALAVARPVRIFLDELLAGLALGLLLAPAAPFLAGRVRTRITDSLPFPLLWLALLLLIVGGVSILEVDVLPGVVFAPALFLASILLYAPAAWFVALGFSVAELDSQRRFVARAWRARGGRFHFGQLRVTDEPEGTTTDV